MLMLLKSLTKYQNFIEVTQGSRILEHVIKKIRTAIEIILLLVVTKLIIRLPQFIKQSH